MPAVRGGATDVVDWAGGGGDLLAHNPEPSEYEIREALSGNLCRCTGYAKIFDAVRLAAGS